MIITANQLKYAIATGEIALYYQPIYQLIDGADQLAGFEALSRWGDIPPYKFLAAAQQHRLLEHFCRWVFSKAIAQTAEWQLEKHGLWLSVNLDPMHLLDGGLAGEIKGMAIAAGVNPANLHLEITEGEGLGAGEIESLKKLAIDFNIGLDDFGRGYSNWDHISAAPISFLKIDRSLRPDRLGDRRKIDTLQSIVFLARTLGITTILEGIETAEQRAIAIVCGVNLGQGWLWARAVPAAIAREMF